MPWRQAGGLRPGDFVYLFINPRYVPLLDRVFAKPEGPDLTDTAFFGEFPLTPNATIIDVATTYGLPTPPGIDTTRTLAETFEHFFDGRAAPGDRIPIGYAEIIVREVDDDGNLVSLGLGLEPQKSTGLVLPPWLARVLAPFNRRQRLRIRG